MKAHKPVYRPILNHALQTAWYHRELWPVAALAGLAGTGAVLNDVLNQAKFAMKLPQGSFWPDWNELLWSDAYATILSNATPAQVIGMTVITLSSVFLAAIAIAACQQALLQIAHRAAAKKAPLPWSAIKQQLNHPRLFRFLGLDLLAKFLVINMLVSASVLIASLNDQSLFDVGFGLIFTFSALMFALIINVLVMLALIGVARKDLNISGALNYAWNLFKQQPLICLEMSCLLFAVNFVITAAYSGALLIFSVPAILSFAVALETSSLLMTAVLITVSVLVAVTLTLVFAGFATTFTYSAWSALAEYLAKNPKVSPRILAHSQHLLAHVRS